MLNYHCSPGSERGDLFEVGVSPEPLFTYEFSRFSYYLHVHCMRLQCKFDGVVLLVLLLTDFLGASVFRHTQDMYLPGSSLPHVRESKSCDCTPSPTRPNSKYGHS